MIQASDVVENVGALGTQVVMWVVVATNFENASMEECKQRYHIDVEVPEVQVVKFTVASVAVASSL